MTAVPDPRSRPRHNGGAVSRSSATARTRTNRRYADSIDRRPSERILDQLRRDGLLQTLTSLELQLDRTAVTTDPQPERARAWCASGRRPLSPMPRCARGRAMPSPSASAPMARSSAAGSGAAPSSKRRHAGSVSRSRTRRGSRSPVPDSSPAARRRPMCLPRRRSAPHRPQSSTRTHCRRSSRTPRPSTRRAWCRW